jgi:biopolymer transport protein ExbB/TolQ
MSVTDAILIATLTFVAVIVALSIIVRVGLGKQGEKLLELRDEQKRNLELSRTSTLEARERIEQARQRAEENHARNDELGRRASENQAHSEQFMARSERNQGRWEQVLSRIEAIVEKLEERGSA